MSVRADGGVAKSKKITWPTCFQKSTDFATFLPPSTCTAKLIQSHCTWRVALTNGFSSSLPGPAGELWLSMCRPCQFCSRSGSLQVWCWLLVQTRRHQGQKPRHVFLLRTRLHIFHGTNHETPIEVFKKEIRFFIFSHQKHIHNIGSQGNQLSGASKML